MSRDNENRTKMRKENRIEKWQWWLLGVWLVFIAVVGFVVLFRLSSIRTAAPPPLPPAPTEFKLGDGPEIEIRGRVLMPDGSPVPPHTFIRTRNITHNGAGYNSVLTDEDGYYTAKVNIGAKFTACVAQYKIEGPHAFPVLVTTVSDRPEPGRYDIQATADTIRLHGRFRHPDGSPASATRTLIAEAHVFGRAPLMLSRDVAGNVREETIKEHFWCNTQDEGVYEIFLPPGEYTLGADAFMYEEAPREEITLTAGDGDREIDFTVRPSSRFHFVMPDGTDVDPEDLMGRFDSLPETGSIHAQGNFRSDVLLSRAGTFLLVETGRKSNTKKAGRYGIVLAFAGVEKLEPTTVTLQPASKAKIRLLDKEDGQPLVGLPLFFSSDFYAYEDGYSSQRMARGSSQSPRVQTDENGVAILEPLYVGGEYDVGIDGGFHPFPPAFRPVEGGKLYDLGDWKVTGNFAAYKKPDTPEENVTEIRTPDMAGEQGHDE